jgi:hypothetical protein
MPRWPIRCERFRKTHQTTLKSLRTDTPRNSATGMAAMRMRDARFCDRARRNQTGLEKCSRQERFSGDHEKFSELPLGPQLDLRAAVLGDHTELGPAHIHL